MTLNPLTLGIMTKVGSHEQPLVYHDPAFLSFGVHSHMMHPKIFLPLDFFALTSHSAFSPYPPRATSWKDLFLVCPCR